MSDALQNVLIHPRSVSARRALALHWRSVGDPKADLIELQLRAHDGLGVLSWDTVPDQIRELLADHGPEWAGRIAELVEHYRYELGMVSQIGMRGDVFIEHAEELVSLAPIVHLLLGVPLDMRRLCGLPAFAQMSTLVVDGGSWIGDSEAIAIAESPNSRGLRVIVLPCGAISEVGLRALAESPNLRDIVAIELTGNPCESFCEQVNEDYFLIGDAGRRSLQAAYSVIAQSYTGGLVMWPPPWTNFTFTD